MAYSDNVTISAYSTPAPTITSTSGSLYVDCHPSLETTWKTWATPAIASDEEEDDMTIPEDVRKKAEELLKIEATEALLPYPAVVQWDEDGDITVFCPKCGDSVGEVSFMEEDSTEPEHLRWRCVCGYVWKTKPKE